MFSTTMGVICYEHLICPHYISMLARNLDVFYPALYSYHVDGTTLLYTRHTHVIRLSNVW